MNELWMKEKERENEGLQELIEKRMFEREAKRAEEWRKEKIKEMSEN